MRHPVKEVEEIWLFLFDVREHMKTFLLMITVISAIVGCSGKSETKRELSANGETISENAYAVDELADKAVADREAYMGKEVVVQGYIAHQPKAEGGGYTISLKFDPRVHKERQLSCTIPNGTIPDDISNYWDGRRVTVKGKIADIHSQNYMDLKSVKLNPCELISY